MSGVSSDLGAVPLVALTSAHIARPSMLGVSWEVTHHRTLWLEPSKHSLVSRQPLVKKEHQIFCVCRGCGGGVANQ